MGVHLHGDRAGRWCDFASGERGDALDLVAAVLRLNMTDAIRWACDWLGVSSGGDYSRVRARTGGKQVDNEEAAQRRKACWLWSQGKPIAGTIVETYLRSVRGYGGLLPGTLRFLPARGNHGPAMIAPFGLPSEPEPGWLAIAADDVMAVHITRLRADGLGKAGTGTDKIMIGRSLGSPIVLAPPNDLLGMAITEGIEDALSVHEATGLGAWAAGSASRMPAIADAIPGYIESVTVVADDDAAGRRHATELARRLVAREIDTRITLPGVWKVAV
jgi:hypothetical protein